MKASLKEKLMLLDLAFDNWRVLHGRSAFTGEREMCGAYSLCQKVLVTMPMLMRNSEHGRFHLQMEDVELLL